MPHLSLRIGPSGPTFEFFVAVSVPLSDALKKSGKTVPAPILVKGLIDTGASCTCIDPSVLKQLGITPKAQVPVHTPSTQSGVPHMANQYDICLILPHQKLSWQFNAVPIIESELTHQGIQALFGRDILSHCLFTYDGAAQIFCLGF
jgi:hypothetical protein